MFLVFHIQPRKHYSQFYLLQCTVSVAAVLNFYVNSQSFFYFLSNLVLSTDKVIVVGDFNIHVDVDNNSFSVAFISLIDWIGFSQSVNKPIKIDHLIVFPQNPILSDHFLITFEFLLLD